ISTRAIAPPDAAGARALQPRRGALASGLARPRPPATQVPCPQHLREVDRLEPDRLDALLERARQIRVLVVGDLMLDVYLRGSASRISPEAPVPVVRVRERWNTLGGAATVARNVVELGAACELV